MSDRTIALLQFLRDAAELRYKRTKTYSDFDEEHIFWLGRLPRGLSQEWEEAVQSPFYPAGRENVTDVWLEVRKRRQPVLPPFPEELRAWVPEDLKERPENYLSQPLDELVTLLIPDPEIAASGFRPSDEELSSSDGDRTSDKAQLGQPPPHVEDAWIQYLESHWGPWTYEMRMWRNVQHVYERIDFMRRRIEEAEERYELVMAVGLLQWRDSAGAIVKRHLLTAPAEIDLDAGRGILTVRPPASFETFRLELDMLEPVDRPNLENTDIERLLDELDVRAWDASGVAKILHVIANKMSAAAQVQEESWEPIETVDSTPRLLYAPALVLRERRPTAYGEIIDKFLAAFRENPSLPTTAPWNRFISEGLPGEGPFAPSPDSSGLPLDSDDHIYFPRPTNEEQRQIIERLRSRPYVLVKGPPGTGKSHTIANLICHLLANGERILVTAHAPKALTVLRELLPEEFRDLCVTASGSSQEDYRFLEEGVRRILTRKDEWKGSTWAETEIKRLHGKLDDLEDEASRSEHELKLWREAETVVHQLPGGYVGTMAQIARRVEEESPRYSWFLLADEATECPIELEEATVLADLHAKLNPALLNELQLTIGVLPIPTPEEFLVAINNWEAAQREAARLQQATSNDELSALQACSNSDLQACKTFLDQLEDLIPRATRRLQTLTVDILRDLLIGHTTRWDRLFDEAHPITQKMIDLYQRANNASVQVLANYDSAALLRDVRRRLEFLKSGRWQGWGFLAPRVIRDTRYIERSVRVNGIPPSDRASLEILLAFLELQDAVRRFESLWPTRITSGVENPTAVPSLASEVIEQLGALLAAFRRADSMLRVVPAAERERLIAPEERTAWRSRIEAELARRRLSEAEAPFERWLEALRSVRSNTAHPCLADLERAILTRNPELWRLAWDARENIRKQQEKLHQYNNLLDRLESVCPQVAQMARSAPGDPQWSNRLRQLPQAWYWAAAHNWLQTVTNPQRYVELTERQRRLQIEIEKTIKDLASLKAWYQFFHRLDETTEQALIAWSKAVQRIGKGTGKHAWRHRQTARDYLKQCTPKIPAWVMPLHKLWETAEPIPGTFDTIIVDEASQAGVEALILLLMAKKVIVVGDDKQNSPEAVGILEDDIVRLARDHLRMFRFRDEFRPDTSLYDHAHRAFGNPVSLREHFRCVPEIIRFSNNLCYNDAPLIPLREPPPNALPPLCSEFVEEGRCEGEGQRLRNRPEAEALVERILLCLSDEAYDGKTMGVIVLQGYAQAQLIERMLAEHLEPRIRQERKLRCGVPATFQGDERDVMFLSMVVAPNRPYRAQTDLDAKRRFNVAMSRARDQVWLFHSVQLHDLSQEDLRYKLVQFFLSPSHWESQTLLAELDALEREVLHRPRQPGTQPEPYDSWFEVDVALELLRRGYRVRPQFEVAGYRIDLVVEGQNKRLAIECDGEAWHGPERFGHDMVRQRQLERAGWVFLRLRESEFYTNRQSVIARIIDACTQRGIRAIGEQGSDTDHRPVSPPSTAIAQRLDEGPRKRVLQPESVSGARPLQPAVPPRGAHILSGSKPWSAHFPDPRNAFPLAVRAALRRIIEHAGPITERHVFRLYVENCPTLRRVGKNIKRLLSDHLQAMQKAGEIVMEDELGDRSPKSVVIRLPGMPKVKERAAGDRDLLEIPPSELFAVLGQIYSLSPGSSTEEMMRAILNRYGFSRLTASRAEHLERVINHWRRTHLQKLQREAPDSDA